MAIVQLLLALFSRAAGRVANTAFAWATVALFGSVERELHTIQVPYEGWEVLFRKLLLLERRLAGLNGTADRKPRVRAAHR